MKTIILNDGSTIDATSITLEPHFSASVQNWDAFIDLIDRLTPDNLIQIQAAINDNLVVTFTDCELVGTQTVNNFDGSMEAHFYLTGEPAPQTDPSYETAYKILIGEIQA